MYGWFEGRAALWFNPIMEDYHKNPTSAGRNEETNSIFGNYTYFEKAIREQFGAIDEERKAEQKIKEIYQTHSASTYASDLKYWASFLEWDDDVLMSLFYDGLKEDVKDELYKMERPETLTEYVAMAVKIDDHLYQRKLQRKGAKTVNLYGQKKKNQQRGTSYGTHAGPMELGIVQKVDNKKEPKRDFSCYNCGKKGHYARDCRSPKKGNGKGKFRPVKEDKHHLNLVSPKQHLNILTPVRYESPGSPVRPSIEVELEIPDAQPREETPVCNHKAHSRRNCGRGSPDQPREPRNDSPDQPSTSDTHSTWGHDDTVEETSQNPYEENEHELYEWSEIDTNSNPDYGTLDNIYSKPKRTYNTCRTRPEHLRPFMEREDSDIEIPRTDQWKIDLTNIRHEPVKMGKQSKLWIRAITTPEAMLNMQKNPKLREDDDIRMNMQAEGHMTISWASCLWHACLIHLEDKVINQAFPVRIKDQRTIEPYEKEELAAFSMHENYPHLKVASLTLDSEYPYECLNRKRTARQCQRVHCAVHKNEKIGWFHAQVIPGNIHKFMRKIDEQNKKMDAEWETTEEDTSENEERPPRPPTRRNSTHPSYEDQTIDNAWKEVWGEDPPQLVKNSRQRRLDQAEKVAQGVKKWNQFWDKGLEGIKITPTQQSYEETRDKRDENDPYIPNFGKEPRRFRNVDHNPRYQRGDHKRICTMIGRDMCPDLGCVYHGEERKRRLWENYDLVTGTTPQECQSEHERYCIPDLTCYGHMYEVEGRKPGWQTIDEARTRLTQASSSGNDGRSQTLNMVRRLPEETIYERYVIEIEIAEKKLIAEIDTGAANNFIDHRVVNQLQLPWGEKEGPYSVANCEGNPLSYNNGNVSKRTQTLKTSYAGVEMDIGFDIIELETVHILLGRPWLRRENPLIDFATGQVTLAERKPAKLSKI